MTRSKASGQTGKPGRIILIEDDEDVGRLVEFKLKKEGFQVVWKQDGMAGLDAIRNSKPGLVILDVMLPKLDGFQVLRKVKGLAATKNIPVIMLTAKTQEEDVVRGLDTGAVEYLTKPFRPAELMLRVKRFFNSNH